MATDPQYWADPNQSLRDDLWLETFLTTFEDTKPMATPAPKTPRAKKAPAAPAVALPKPTVQSLLHPSVLTLFLTSPQNPVVRGLILRDTGLYIPEEKTTLAEMQEWLEAQTPLVKPKVASAAVVKFEIGVTEQQRRNATYRGEARDTVPLTLTAADIAAIAEKCENSEQFEEKLWEKIEDMADNRAAPTIAVDNREITSDEVEEADDREYDYHGEADNIIDQVINILREIDPNKASEMFE